MASKSRTDWSLLLLRVAIALAFLSLAWPQIRHGSSAATFANAWRWSQLLAQVIAAFLLLIGLWTTLATLPLLLIQGWPLVHSLLHGADPLALKMNLLLLLVTLACTVGGPGKWAVGKG